MTTTPTTPTTPTIQTQSRTPTQELYIPYWTNMRQTRNDDVSPISSNMNMNMSMNMNMNMSMNMNMNMTMEGYRSMPSHSTSTMAREQDSMMMMMPSSYDNNNDNEVGDEDLVIRSSSSSSSSSSLMTKEEEGEESGNRAFGIGAGFSSISSPNYLFETQRYNNDNNTESV